MPHSQAPVAAGLQAIHANHLEDLRRVVVWLIREYPIAPLEDETFLVQSNGIAQWLKLALAEHPRDEQGATQGGIGIAAAMAFSLPSRFVWQAYRAVLGADYVPPESPYDKDRLTWRLYGLLPSLTREAQYAPLARFLDGAESDRRRYQLAEKIADLYDQYQVFRADWLSAWEDGDDHLIPARGEPLSLGDEQRWQPALWRRLVAGMTAAERPSSRSRIHTQFMAAAKQLTPAQRPAGLPRRIIVFGVSSLPQQTLEVLDALGHCCQVVLCVHNPCSFYWADIVSDRDLLRAERKRGAVRDNLHTPPDPDQLHLHAQPLLAAWGKQGRDYIRLLDQFDNPDQYRGGFATAGQRVDIFELPQGDQLLHQIQADITELRPLHETRHHWPQLDAQQDRSLVFHSAHSPQREVEILHDQLLAAFNADATLRPRDTIVMVPDINLYAPHIQAVFGRYRPEHRCHIPFTISDQGQRHQVPLLVALEQLLGLPESRFGVSEILSLLAVPALRERFAIAEADLPRLHQWIDQANIRWGLDGQHRQDLDLPPGLERNTWLSGLQRMLAGFALGDGDAWQGIEPYGEVGGLEAAMAGQLDRFLQRLGELRQELNTPASAEDWLLRIDHLRNTFFAQLDEADLIAWNRFQGSVETWFAATRDAAIDDELLPLAIVREVWLEGLDQGGLNQRFLAGSVNFATLMPMRAIPFRRVCLLGMNDGDYPRSRPPLDFDLMARDYRPGDRSRREDDRYLFLEALLSAREQLYISWVGRSVRDNSVRPPSVLVGQLRDHINSGWTLQSVTKEQTPADALTTQHPLQPFSSAYFPPL
ncbi:MAG: exodeoxyribonuclease V subunit gamma, partial [Halomonadaceae bacterium]